MPMRRVVVTGNGDGHAGRPRPGRDSWAALQEGRSGVGRAISLFDASRLSRHRIAAEVNGLPALRLYVEDGARWDEHCQEHVVRHRRGAGWPSISRAWKSIGLKGLDRDPVRRSTWARGKGSRTFPRFVKLVHASWARQWQGRHRRGSPDRVPTRTSPDPRGRAGAGHASRSPGGPLRGPMGPNANCLTACAPPARRRLARRPRLIRRGDADVMLSGGTHSMIHPFGVTGFNLLTALSTRNGDPTEGQSPV